MGFALQRGRAAKLDSCAQPRNVYGVLALSHHDASSRLSLRPCRLQPSFARRVASRGRRCGKEEDSVLHQVERLRAFADLVEKGAAQFRRESAARARGEEQLGVYLLERRVAV